MPAAVFDAIRADGRAYSYEVIAGSGGDRIVAGGTSSRPLPPFFWDLDARFAWLDEHRVDIQAISPVCDLVSYRLPAEHTAWMSRVYNEGLAELAGRHPDRLRLVASVPLQDPALAAAELEHAVRALDARAVQIATNVRGKHLEGAEFDPFWAKAQELGVLVMLHPGNMGAYPPMEDYHLNVVLAFPFDTAVTAASLICGGVLDRYPDLRICLPHGGGLLSYQITRLDRAYQTGMMPQTLKDLPLDYFKRFYFDTVLDDPSALAFLIEKVGADRLMLGTDHPFEMQIDAVRTIESIPGLTAAERDQILGGTARSLLEVGSRAERRP